MFVWSYWKTIFSNPSNPSKEVHIQEKSIFLLHVCPFLLVIIDDYLKMAFSQLQFCLPKAEKERYEKEERPESQQEILWRAASNLPLYTRTGAGGTSSHTPVSKASVFKVDS